LYFKNVLTGSRSRNNRNAILISALLCVLAFPCAAQPDSAGWLTLFNGSDLENWNGDPDIWRVENGYISGGLVQTPTTFMWYEPRTFDDFILEMEVFLIDNYGNAGIQYRSEVIDTSVWMVMGYQADIGPGIWGNLYDEHRRDLNLAMPSLSCTESVNSDDWNHYRIRAEGFTLTHSINNIECLEYTDADTLNRAAEGLIAIQVHSPGDFEIRYRNIRILPLNEPVSICAPVPSSSDMRESPPGPVYFFNILGRRKSVQRSNAQIHPAYGEYLFR
jgi:hypothetical protein